MDNSWDSLQWLGPILFIADFLHPINHVTVELFLNGYVCHCCCCRCPVPMFFSRWKPDHIAWANFLYRATPVLCQASARRDNQLLTQRMSMPRGSRPRLECHTGCNRTCRCVCLKQWVNAYRSGKPVSRAFAGRLCAVSCDVHNLMMSFGLTDSREIRMRGAHKRSTNS